MRPLIIAAIASVGVAGFVTGGPAKAQAVRPQIPPSANPYGPYGPNANPYGSPGISPYLNLLRAGGTPAVNYYGLVRPQQAYNYALSSLEQQVTASRVAATAAENLAAPSTGHPIYFNSGYQRFFLNTGAVAPFQNVQATVGGGAAAGSTAGSRFTANAAYGASNPSFRRY